MKQRIAAGVLLLAAVFLFCSMAASSKQTAGIRVKAPEAEDSGAQYYYESTVNPFYPELAPYYEVKGGYITGNCLRDRGAKASSCIFGRCGYLVGNEPERRLVSLWNQPEKRRNRLL